MPVFANEAIGVSQSMGHQWDANELLSHSANNGTLWAFLCHKKSHFPREFGHHLEERLLDQAQARASYTPPFWGGHSRSISQGMIFDVQPLVKSVFCPIKQSSNGFFLLVANRSVSDVSNQTDSQSGKQAGRQKPTVWVFSVADLASNSGQHKY